MEIKRFGRIREVIPLPPLTEIQVESYRRALQADVPPEKRENVGIQAAFRETFPIEEEDKGKGGLVLDFLEYRLGEPPFPQDECREKDLTYQAPLYARHGVQEVWVVDLVEGRVHRFLDPSPGGYREHHVLGPGDTLSPRAFPGLSVSVASLL